MKRRGYFSKDPIKFLCIVISISCTFILSLSILKLHEIPIRTINAINSSGRGGIGKLGELVIKMLPQDLGFTLFLPSDKAFKRDLGLVPNDLVGEKGNDTYVILTRVLGFSAVPRMISSVDVPYGKELDFDSISGYTLYVSKDFGGSLIVNRIASEMVDLKSGNNIVVHVMDGAIMDSEFEQSVRPGIDGDD